MRRFVYFVLRMQPVVRGLELSRRISVIPCKQNNRHTNSNSKLTESGW